MRDLIELKKVNISLIFIAMFFCSIDLKGQINYKYQDEYKFEFIH